MGAFKLGKMTFGSLFKKPETTLYPLETKPQPVGLKGHITNDVADCILCGMCQRSCTTGCITVDKQARTWTIDRLQCVQCGYCITVCPKKCLAMDPNYAPATTVREPDVFEVPEQGSPSKEPSKLEKQVTAADDAPHASQNASQEPVALEPGPHDAQLEALLALMPSDKVEKVRASLKQ